MCPFSKIAKTENLLLYIQLYIVHTSNTFKQLFKLLNFTLLILLIRNFRKVFKLYFFVFFPFVFLII